MTVTIDYQAEVARLQNSPDAVEATWQLAYLNELRDRYGLSDQQERSEDGIRQFGGTDQEGDE